MKISRNWLQKYFKNDLPGADVLSQASTFHVFEVEEVVTAGDDSILDLKVLPDRAHYCLGHLGIAQEFSAILNLHMKEGVNDLDANKIPGNTKRKISVSVQDSEFCPRYMARMIEGVKVSESPEWLRTKLESIGARSINSVVDITNYVMFDLGQPLHAFDADKVKGNIQVRYASEGEKITTLDGKEVVLTSKDSVIADDEGPLAIAGVKGGNRAEVDINTRNIILEAANFNATAVRKTSTRVGIKNDSVKRYENDISPIYTEMGMNLFLKLLYEIHSEKMETGPVVDMYPVPVSSWSFDVPLKYINEKLGIDVPKDTAIKILKSLDIGVVEKGDILTLSIPPHRLDLKIKEDIAEEVGRINGYEKIAGTPLPPTKKSPEVNKNYYYTEKIKNVLRELGFYETYLYSLVPKGEFELAYPLASDKAFLRKDLVTGLLKSVSCGVLNADLMGLKIVKAFEFGKIFKATPERKEELHLALAVTMVKKIKGQNATDILNGTMAEIVKIIPDLNYKVETTGNIAHVEISLDEMIASLPQPQSYEDLNFEIGQKIDYKRFSPFPFIVRDIAVFVPETVTDAEVWQKIEKGINTAGANDLLERHELFDLFKKDGKISMAFRMVFQSMEKTLTDVEANKIMDEIYKVMNESGYQVR